MVTYNSKVGMARLAGREHRFRSLVRNQARPCEKCLLNVGFL